MEILVAEDDYDIAMQYQIALEARKHHLVTTYNGEECLKAYHDALKRTEPGKSPFDVVILDYRMPKKDGLEAAKEILAACPQQRIIFASAYVKEVLDEAGKELKHPFELLQKPFRLSLLIDKVEAKEAAI